jgi:hypothetical protein
MTLFHIVRFRMVHDQQLTTSSRQKLFIVVCVVFLIRAPYFLVLVGDRSPLLLHYEPIGRQADNLRLL